MRDGIFSKKKEETIEDRTINFLKNDGKYTEPVINFWGGFLVVKYEHKTIRHTLYRPRPNV